jgi:prepilin-type processing-associated H-X9-DG protein
MRFPRNRRGRAFTLAELLVTLVILIVLATILLPALARPRHHHGNPCVNNLKQIGIAFRTWALDHGDKFPMQVSVMDGGTMELVSSGSVFPHFLAMSNELSTPRLLVCSEESDPRRRPANTFATNASARLADVVPFNSDNQVGYFVGVDAGDVPSSLFLCGDRNLAINGVPAKHGLLELRTNSAISWGKPRHGGAGNIALADGSVQGWSSLALGAAVRSSTLATNRLAIP